MLAHRLRATVHHGREHKEAAGSMVPGDLHWNVSPLSRRENREQAGSMLQNLEACQPLSGSAFYSLPCPLALIRPPNFLESKVL